MIARPPTRTHAPTKKHPPPPFRAQQAAGPNCGSASAADWPIPQICLIKPALENWPGNCCDGPGISRYDATGRERPPRDFARPARRRDHLLIDTAGAAHLGDDARCRRADFCESDRAALAARYRLPQRDQARRWVFPDISPGAAHSSPEARPLENRALQLSPIYALCRQFKLERGICQ